MSKSTHKKTVYAVKADSDDSDSSESSNGNQLWCICRSRDSSRFMIACDACEEWYHGDCINITPKMAENILQYFCACCRKKNHSLKMVYKNAAMMNKPKERADNGERAAQRKEVKVEKVVKLEKIEKPIKIENKLDLSNIQSQKSIKSYNCGDCMGCLRKVDCYSCQNCRTKSGNGCLRRVCQKKQDLIVEKTVVKPQEKMMLTKLPMDFIPARGPVITKKPVVTKPPPSTLQPPHHNPTVPKSVNNGVGVQRNVPSSSSSLSSEPAAAGSRPLITRKRQVSPPCSSRGSSSAYSVGNINNKLCPPPIKKSKVKEESRNVNLEDTVTDNDDEEDEEEEEEDEDNEINESDEDDSDNQISEESEEPLSEDGNKPQKKIVTNQPIKKTHHKQISQPLKKSARLQSKVSNKLNNEQIKNYKSFICYNIGCTKPSKMGSKYCSNECGISLAEQRLLKYLPDRINNWKNTVSIADEQDKQALIEIKNEMKTIHHNLDILNTSHDDLTEFIERWRTTCSAVNSVDSGVNDDSVECVTCGALIASVKALAHMENCFQKIEGATMVFGDYEEQPLGTKLFCDYYDSNINGFCKRLAALCDHTKDTKVDTSSICAFPLSVNKKSEKVCMAARVKCNQHINWERIQRAVIDINRYRLLVRFEDLLSEDRRLKQNMSQRGGVMDLLTHETIDHQPLNSMLPVKVTGHQEKKMAKFTKAICI